MHLSDLGKLVEDKAVKLYGAKRPPSTDVIQTVLETDTKRGSEMMTNRIKWMDKYHDMLIAAGAIKYTKPANSED